MAHQPAKPQVYAYSLIVLLLLGWPVFGQDFHTQHETTRKASKAFKSAESYYRSGDYQKCFPFLYKATAEDPVFIEAWLMLGDAADEIDSLSLAIDAYEKAYDLSRDFYPGLEYLLASQYVQNQQYDEALNMLKVFVNRADLSEEYHNKAAELMAIATFRKEAYINPLEIDLLPLNDLINTDGDEYVNALRMDGSQLLFTRRKEINNAKALVEQVFLANRKEGIVRDLTAFEPQHWPIHEQIGAITFSADGKSVVFAACGWPDGKGSCDLYWSDLEKDKWTVPVNLSNLNSANWDSQPALSADGQQIIFSSNRPGGFGGSDLWVSHFKEGVWTVPVNLGDVINTAKNEMAPFWHFDNNTLYFSSDGHPGMGGMDLFLSRKDSAGKWQKPVNLGFPINSGADEMNLVVDAAGNTAMISAKSDSTDHYDIFSFDLPLLLQPEPVTYVELLVTDKETAQPLIADVIVSDPVMADELVTMQTDENGLAFVVLPARKHLVLQVNADQYLYYEKSFRPENGTELKPVLQKVELEPIKAGKTIVLENVLFELNKAVLLPEALAGLKNLETFLKRNPDLTISLEGHTDTTGEEDFNLKLSLDRAQAVADFLLANEINADRLLIRGFGSDKPLESNDNEIGRAKNRRVEMRIVN
ncbi:MAG: OmpA family protein [Bacteroidales bacterium]|nr:OmpA family protein [Bacteroidales bacterium]